MVAQHKYDNEAHLFEVVQEAINLHKNNYDNKSKQLIESLLSYVPRDKICAAQSANRAILELQAYDLLQNQLLNEQRNDHKYRLVVLGDSHVYAFNYIGKNRLMLPYFFECKIVGGATAQGLANPDSKTNALMVFNDYLTANKKPHRALLFQLGEVDCGFLMWFRKKHKNESLEYQLNKALKHYEILLLKAQQLGWRSITLCSAPLPTIIDGVTQGEVATARGTICVSRRDKTDLTIEYNQRLENLAKKHQFGFLDITQHTIDPLTYEVDDKFLNEDPSDHHLSYENVAPLWISELKEKLLS